MGNKFATAEARKHWNAYNSAYAKKNYKVVTVKFSLKNDKDIIDYISKFDLSSGMAVKKILTDIVRGNK